MTLDKDKIVNITIRGYDDQSFREDFIEQLRKKGLLKKSLAYVGLDPKHLKTIKRLGKLKVDQSIAFYLTKDQLIEVMKDGVSHSNPLTYGESEENGDVTQPVMIVVYQKSKLIKGKLLYEYHFKENVQPNELVKAVLLIKYKPI